MVRITLGPRLAASKVASSLFPYPVSLPKFLVLLAYIFFPPAAVNALIAFDQPKHRKWAKKFVNQSQRECDRFNENRN